MTVSVFDEEMNLIHRSNESGLHGGEIFEIPVERRQRYYLRVEAEDPSQSNAREPYTLLVSRL